MMYKNSIMRIVGMKTETNQEEIVMTKFSKRLVISLLSALLMLSLIAVGACSGGKKASLKLNAGDGGAFGNKAEAEYSVKIGDDLNEFLKGKEPTPVSGVTFGGWFEGNTQLAADAVMPEEGLTLTARYLASYTLNVYLENESGEYEKSETKTESGWYHRPFSAETQAPTGYELDAAQENVYETSSLEPNAVFNVWYKRAALNVFYLANVPQGAEIGGTTAATAFRYGETPTVAENGYTAPAQYRFAGWSEDLNGTGTRYHAGDVLENLSANVTLYAIWDKGYTDRFGGTDVVFFPSDEEGVAVLSRAGKEFKGTAGEDGESFTFTLTNGKTLSGKTVGSTFSFTREEVAGTYYQYSNYVKVPSLASAEWTYVGEDSGYFTVKGTYSYDRENDLYTFTPSADAGNVQPFRFFLYEYLTGDDPVTVNSAFVILGEEEGEYVQFIPTTMTGYGRIGSIGVVLSGYGLILYEDAYTNEQRMGYYYISGTKNAGYMITAYLLTSAQRAEEFNFYTTSLSGDLKAIVIRNQETNITLQGTIDGSAATLVLDGYDGATLTIDGTPEEGAFFATDTEVFGTVVHYVGSSGERWFRLVTDAQGNTAFEVFYEVEEYARLAWLEPEDGQPSNYRIYHMLALFADDVKDANGTVLGKHAAIYARTAEGYELVSEGYVKDKEGGIFQVYTRQTLTESHAEDDEFYAKNTTFSFRLSDAFSPSVYLIYEFDDQPDYTKLSDADGASYVLRFNGLKIDSYGDLLVLKDGTVYEGKLYEGTSSYFTTKYDTHYYAFEADASGADSVEFWMEKKDDTTYYTLEYAPYSLFLQTEDGTVKQPAFMYLDGKGGADVYSEPPVNFATATPVRGKVAKTGEVTLLGDDVWQFTPTETSQAESAFKFILEIVSENTTIYHKYYGEGKTFTSEEGSLTIDGYNYRAEFEEDGTVYRGQCHITTADNLEIEMPEGFETIYIMQLENGRLITFFFKEDGSFKIGSLYGMYMLADENYGAYKNNVYILMFDGVGGFTMMGSDESMFTGTCEAVDLDAGTYMFKVTSKTGDEGNLIPEEFLAQVLDAGTMGPICVVHNESLDTQLVADDWSVLNLDGFGNGTYTDGMGATRPIAYLLLEDGVGVVGDNTWQQIFTFDKAKKTFALVDHTAYVTSYYAADLASVVFTQTMAYVNGKNSYYTVSGSTVTLYTQTESGNFEKSTMTYPTADTLTISEKTFYRYKGGELQFTDTQHQIPISFTPNGANFRVAMTFADAKYDGYYLMQVGYNNGKLVTEILCATDESFAVTLNWNQSGDSTFTFAAEPTEHVETYTDYMSVAEIEGKEEKLGTITLKYNTYGVYVVSGTVTGDLAYATDTNGNPLSFEVDISELLLVEEDVNVGGIALDRYIVSFTGKDNIEYVVSFLMGGLTLKDTEQDLFILYMINTYSELEAPTDFTVVAQQYVYSNFYTIDGIKKMDLMSVSLYLSTEQGDVRLQAADSMRATPDNKHAFFTAVIGQQLYQFRIDFELDDKGHITSVTAVDQVQVYFDLAYLSGQAEFGAVVLGYAFDEEGNGTLSKYTFYYYGAEGTDKQPLIITADAADILSAGTTAENYRLLLAPGVGSDEQEYAVMFVSGLRMQNSNTFLSSLHSVYRVNELTQKVSDTTYVVQVAQCVYANAYEVPVGSVLTVSLYVRTEKDGESTDTYLDPDLDSYDAEKKELTWVWTDEKGTHSVLVKFTAGTDGMFTSFTVVDQTPAVTTYNDADAPEGQAGTLKISSVNGSAASFEFDLPYVKDTAGTGLKFTLSADDLLRSSELDATKGYLYQGTFQAQDKKTYQVRFYYYQASDKNVFEILLISLRAELTAAYGEGTNFNAYLYQKYYAPDLNEEDKGDLLSAGLYLGQTYLTPYLAWFDQEGKWFVWSTAQGQNMFYFYVEITYGEDKWATSMTVTQGSVAAFAASGNQYGVRIFYYLDDQKKPVVCALLDFGTLETTQEGTRVNFYTGSVITKTADGTWTVVTPQNGTFTVKIAVNAAGTGFDITVTSVPASASAVDSPDEDDIAA